MSKTIERGELPDGGDRVRIIGYDDLLNEDRYRGFPRQLLTVPGNSITEVDGVDRSDVFSAFVHAPFKTDCAGPRNEASIALQVDLMSGDSTGHALLFGDLSYPTLKRIFDFSNEKRDGRFIEWDVMLAPHHCSKSIMYFKDEGEKEETLKQDILDMMSDASEPGAYVVASSNEIPTTNKSGDNPPHARAKARYEEIVDANHFICTMEHGPKTKPERVEFHVTADGFSYVELKTQEKRSRANAIAAAIVDSRGASSPH